MEHNERKWEVNNFAKIKFPSYEYAQLPLTVFVLVMIDNNLGPMLINLETVGKKKLFLFN